MTGGYIYIGCFSVCAVAVMWTHTPQSYRNTCTVKQLPFFPPKKDAGDNPSATERKCALHAVRRSIPTWCVCVEEIPDGNGDLVAHGWQCGAGVQHVGAKVAQLPGLVVGQGGQTHSLRDLGGGVAGVTMVCICVLTINNPWLQGIVNRRVLKKV